MKASSYLQKEENAKLATDVTEHNHISFKFHFPSIQNLKFVKLLNFIYVFFVHKYLKSITSQGVGGKHFCQPF